MKNNQSFILKPLTISCVVAMTTTGCAIDDDVNVSNSANLIVTNADSYAISASEAKQRAERAMAIYEEARQKANEAEQTAKQANAQLSSQANALQQQIKDSYQAWLTAEQEAQGFAEQKRQAQLDKDEVKQAEFDKLEKAKLAEAQQLFNELETAKTTANQLFKDAQEAEAKQAQAIKEAEEARKKAEAEKARQEQAIKNATSATNQAVSAVNNITTALTTAQNTANTAQNQATKAESVQSAISQANIALQQANVVINQANTALLQAQKALDDAKKAGADATVVAQAQKAVSDAQKAISDAQSIRTQADNARKTAEQTQKDAQTQAEQEKAEKERLEKEKAEREKAEQERLAKEQAIKNATNATNQAVSAVNGVVGAVSNAQKLTEQANNQATNNDTAQSAINTANNAKTEAQTALTNAQNAKKQAEQALKDAQSAGADQSVIDKAQKAINDANTAITNAQKVQEQADKVITTAQKTQEEARKKAEAEAQQNAQNQAQINTIKGNTDTINTAITGITQGLDETQSTANIASEQAKALRYADDATQNANRVLAETTTAEQSAQAQLDKAKAELDKAKAISANNEAVTTAQTAVKNAEFALQKAREIKKQAEQVSTQVADTEKKSYVAPIADSVIKTNKPNYTRTTSANLQNAQPRPSDDTITGYGRMDYVFENEILENKTEAIYGLDQNAYAKKLHELKTSIDTTGLAVGVIDTGVYDKNLDLQGAKLSDFNLIATDATICQSSNKCFEEVGYRAFTPKDSHGSNMAAIIAGNNGMTNATIYSYADGHNNYSEFLGMRELNQRSGGQVKIFNNSWGYIPESTDKDEWLTEAKKAVIGTDTANSSDPEVRAIHELIMEKDALLIHATGNEGKDDTFGERLIPTLNPDLKRGFLTVSTPREDFAQANYCGRSADWCLSAPSTTYSYTNEGKLNDYKGTSPATARVTGTALLVKGAYPWMTNKNLVETLLSTAKDFNEIKAQSPTYTGFAPATDKEYQDDYNNGKLVLTDESGQKYTLKNVSWQNRTVVNNIGGKDITRESGWGMLDTLSATQGYGGFYWNDVVLDTKGVPLSVFSNNLKGEYGFTKAGEGKLVLTGNNSYKGNTIITGGTLEINGNNGTSKVEVKSGELTGYGKVGSVTQTGGTVNNEGNLTIAGDYTMNDHSTFKAKFGNLLTVTGTAGLDGKLDLYDEVTQNEPLITANGSKTTVLRAGQLNGTFKTVTSSNPLFGIIKTEYSGKVGTDGVTTPDATTKTDVVVSAYRKSVTSLGQSVGASSAGRSVVERNLDKTLAELDSKESAGTLTTDEKDFAVRFANTMAMATTKTMLASTSASTTTNTTANTSTPALVADKYNEALFALDPAFYANNAVHVMEHSATGATDFAKNMSNGSGAWFNSTYQDYELDLPSSPTKSEREVRNQSIGVAKHDGRTGVGLQLDLGNLDLNEQNGSTTHNIDTKVASLTVGMNTALSDNTNATTWAKAGVVKSDAQNNSREKHSYDGNLYAGGVQVGTTYTPTHSLTVKPYVGVSYYQYKHDNASFNDGTHTVKDIDASRWQATVGIDGEYQVSPQWYVKAGVQYDNAFNQDASVNSAFNGTSTNLDFEAWDTGKDKVQATVGTGYQVSPRTRVGVEYDYFKSEKSDGDRVQLTISSQF